MNIALPYFILRIYIIRKFIRDDRQVLQRLLYTRGLLFQ